MYAWKCWRESRARFIFLLMMFTACAFLFTLMQGLEERDGWWHFDRSVYTRDPATMVHLVSLMVLSGLWCCGFLSAVFLGATASGSEIEPGTIEYLWTRPRTRTSVTWTHWGICLAEMVLVAVVPTYLAAVILGTLTGTWNLPLLLVAPWIMVIVGLPILGLTTLMTALRRSASGGLIYTTAVVSVYVIVRQIVTVPLHLNLPTLFAGPLVWLTTTNQPDPIAFPWGSLWRAVFLAAAFPLVAQYLLKRAEV
jgi:ABC-type transport system involved in multi-copper enzyme maturation permease subunit